MSELYPRNRASLTAERGAKYQFAINKRWTVDGSPRWNVARYINHSCRPNAKPVGRKGGIAITYKSEVRSIHLLTCLHAFLHDVTDKFVAIENPTVPN